MVIPLATAVFWANFLDMSDILHRFIYQREGNWMGHLCESAKMLPYLTSAGHYKYGQQSMPLYLAEMKKLPNTAPEVHAALMKGAFIHLLGGEQMATTMGSLLTCF
jgi:hypothetical protein